MSRVIRARVRNSAMQAKECVGSLLALELLHPSRYLYLSAPLLRNAPVLANELGQYGALFPEIETASVSLVMVLSLLAECGVTIRLIHPPGEAVADELAMSLPPSVARRVAAPLGYKGIFTEHFSLKGGLHFTEFGIGIEGEEIALVTEPEEVARALIEAEAYWEELG